MPSGGLAVELGGAELVAGQDDHLVDVDPAGAGGHEGDAVGDVLGGEGVAALVDLGGAVGVSAAVNVFVGMAVLANNLLVLAELLAKKKPTHHSRAA